MNWILGSEGGVKVVKYSYYPGNTARQSSSEVEDTIQPMARTLGLELLDITGCNSDGGEVICQTNKMLQLTLNARNFALAEENGHDIVTACATSQGNMFAALRTLRADPVLCAQVNAVLEKTSGLNFKGEIKTSHLLHVLVEEIGLDKINDLVVNPLGVKIAAYYGPNMQREGACGEDDAFNPQYLERLIEALGGEAVDYGSKTASVGAPSLLTLDAPVMQMTAQVLADAKEAGAQMMVSACTISHSNLDSYQSKAAKVTGKNTNMPVIHLSELVAFALGHHVDRFAQLKTRALVIGG
jgi:heterodisulfide reductase subunit B